MKSPPVLFCILLLCAAFCNAHGRLLSDSVWVLSGIQVIGNTRTSTEVILSQLPVRSGDTIGPADIESSRKALESLEIFKNVVVLKQDSPQGAKLLIVTEESLNILPLLSPHRYEQKYGRDETWYSLSGKLYFNNFRGRLETFWIYAELLDKKGFGAGWQQQPRTTVSPYYFWLKGNAVTWPALYDPYDARHISGEGGLGRKLSKFLSWYCRSSYNSVRTDSLGTMDEFQYPTLGTGLSLDTRPIQYPPRQGTYFALGLDQIGKIPANRIDFLQSYVCLADYEPMFFDDHTLVGAFRFTERFRKPGYFFRLHNGGMPLFRGYDQGELSGDNSVAASLEYRMPVWKSFSLRFGGLDNLAPGFGNLYGILDVAFFADASSHWNYEESLADKRLAYAGGIGLRGWVPSFQRSGSVDFAWNRDGEFKWHMYLDIEF